MDSQQRPVILKLRSDTQGTTSTTTKRTISGFSWVYKPQLQFLSTAVALHGRGARLPQGPSSPDACRLRPMDDAGLRLDELGFRLPRAAFVLSSKNLEALRMDSQQRLSTFAPSVWKTAFISAICILHAWPRPGGLLRPNLTNACKATEKSSNARLHDVWVTVEVPRGAEKHPPMEKAGSRSTAGLGGSFPRSRVRERP